MLIVFPFGLWVVSLLCDLLYLGGAEPALWSPLALYSMVGGFVVAFGGAVIGRSAATIHLVVLGLYAVNIWLRVGDPTHVGVAVALSVTGVGMLAVSSWLGADTARVHPKG